jgi:hypothetical protein
MKKSIEKRLQRLESEYLSNPGSGVTITEVGFLHRFLRIWPDPNAAPKFLLAVYNRIATRGKVRPSSAFQFPVAAPQSDGSNESTHG